MDNNLYRCLCSSLIELNNVALTKQFGSYDRHQDVAVIVDQVAERHVSDERAYPAAYRRER